MRIRELILNNVRSFRGEHRISFVDPLTEQARPITVIAGTNGTGKTTILDAMNLLIRYDMSDQTFYEEISVTGFAGIQLELTSEDLLGDGSLTFPQTLWLATGCQELSSFYSNTLESNVICHIDGQSIVKTAQAEILESCQDGHPCVQRVQEQPLRQQSPGVFLHRDPSGQRHSARVSNERRLGNRILESANLDGGGEEVVTRMTPVASQTLTMWVSLNAGHSAWNKCCAADQSVPHVMVVGARIKSRIGHWAPRRRGSRRAPESEPECVRPARRGNRECRE